MASLSTITEQAGFTFFSSLLRSVRLFNPTTASDFGGWIMRKAGPLLKEHAVARDNLTAAFPEKSKDEIDRILDHCWDNFGRIAIEYAFLDKLWDVRPGHLTGARAEISPEVDRRLAAIREGDGPVLLFGCHLANWEIGAVALHRHGVHFHILYRKPSVKSVATILATLRQNNMGTMIAAGKKAPFQLAMIMRRHGRVAMLLDQHLGEGVETVFFGRPCRTNGTFARLARQFECTVYGIRTVRLPGNRYRVDISEPVTPARDTEGKIDVAATTQIINDVIEGWVRQHPEQWLWQHRRWR